MLASFIGAEYIAQAGDEVVPINVIEKNLSPFQASTDDVVTGAGSVYASLTGHDSKSAMQPIFERRKSQNDLMPWPPVGNAAYQLPSSPKRNYLCTLAAGDNALQPPLPSLQRLLFSGVVAVAGINLYTVTKL